MKQLALALALIGAAGVALACHDGMKSMDAQAPVTDKVSTAAVAPVRADAAKARPAKSTAKPAVAVATPVEARKAAGG